MLNETLAYAIVEDYNYALFKNSLSYKKSKGSRRKFKKYRVLKKTPFAYNNSSLFIVDMNNPMTLNQDLEILLKPPYDTNPQILDIIEKTRKKTEKKFYLVYIQENCYYPLIKT